MAQMGDAVMAAFNGNAYVYNITIFSDRHKNMIEMSLKDCNEHVILAIKDEHCVIFVRDLFIKCSRNDGILLKAPPYTIFCIVEG